MLESLRIGHFRVFDDLAVESLNRVNLVTGRNNVGKTSLLEALFLLSGAANPQLALNPNVARGMDTVVGTADTIRETFWKPLFSRLDMNGSVEIEGRHASLGPLSLRVSIERPHVIALPLDGAGRISARNMSGEPPLLLSFRDGSGRRVEGRVRVGAQGLEVEQPDMVVPFRAQFLSTRNANPHEDTVRLGRLRRRKQGDLVLDALRIIEPRLRSIEDSVASGAPMISGDIGLPELVPLAVMGEGMIRIARLVMAVVDSPDGLVLVDEIETGLHHSVLPEVWKAVDAVARRFGTQVVATTHSYECMQAAGRALGGGGFLLHRLEASGAGNRCVTYEAEDIDAAMRHDLEVR